MSTLKTLYPAGSVTIVVSPESAATSSTFAAGVQSDAIVNTSNLDIDHLVSGKWTCGTTPTINTQVQIWVVAPLTDDLGSGDVWPDNFDNGFQTITVTSAGVLYGLGRLAATLTVDSTTSNRTYFCAPFSVAALFGGHLPPRYVIYIAHNTGVNAHATTGNHSWSYLRIQATVA